MPVAPEVVSLFNALPTPHLLLSPAFVIEAVSDAYLHATLTSREHLVGQYMFDAFPDNPQTPEANSMHNVRASLQQVLATGQPQQLAQQHYDVPDPERPGHFVERYWQALNAPVFDAQGNVVQIIHSAVDITAEVQAQAHLGESRAREQQARAEAEAERQRLFHILENFPAVVASYRGPEHVFDLVSHRFQRDFPTRTMKGLPVREALPELVGQQYYEILDGVYQTGEPFYGTELETWVDLTGTGKLELQYYNVCFQATRDAEGRIDGILNFAYDVTDAVLARHHVEQLSQQAQAARTEAEAERQRLHQVLMRIPASIALLRGPEHIYDLVNPAYEQLFPVRTTLGGPIREVIPDIAGQGFYELFDRVYETGEPFYEAEAEVWADFAGTGELQCRYFCTAFEPIRNAQGQVAEVLSFAVDVTAQVEARRQVEQFNQELEARVQQRTQQTLALQADLLAAAQHQSDQRALFYQVFQKTPAAICIQRGPTHRYEYTNAAYQQFFPGRRLLGQAVADAIPETVDSGVVALLDHVYQTGETYHGYELPLLIAQPDGQPPRQMYFTFTYQALRENGEIVGISTFAYNVAEQVLVRQQREEEQQKLAQLFMQAPAPIVILDGPDLVFQLINPAYQRIFPGRALAGKPLLEALPELVGTPIPDLFQGVYQTGEPITVQELPLLMARHEGHAPEEIYWTFTYQARRDRHGQIDGVRVFAHDVTEQVRTRQQVERLNQELGAVNEELLASNEKLHETNRQLTRTNVELDTFVYTASHDLKAPITNIESIVLALRETLPPDVQQDGLIAHLLKLLDNTVARFQVTIAQLTDVSRLQLAQVGPAEPVILAAVVQDVCLDLMPAIAAAGSQLSIAVPAELVVSFSPANLRSIVYNLLSNAVKYRAYDRRSQVQLRAEQTPQAVVLTVQDNGLGMSESQQRQLFGLFQRLHTHVEGSGMGLYISKRLVENAGGTIAVLSQPNVGTTFTVTFPA